MYAALGWAAQSLGVVPLAWLAVRRSRDAAHWWLAVAFGVSFVADCFPHQLASQVYPVSQAALFLAVMLPRRSWTEALIAVLLASAATSILARQGLGLDVALHVLAWLAVSCAAWLFVADRALRWTLGAGFAVLTVAWTWFVVARDFASWGAFQGVRVLMAAGFCWSVYNERRRA